MCRIVEMNRSLAFFLLGVGGGHGQQVIGVITIYLPQVTKHRFCRLNQNTTAIKRIGNPSDEPFLLEPVYQRCHAAARKTKRGSNRLG